MPGIITSFPLGSITKFTNCRLLHHDDLIEGDLWVSSSTGTIISSQTTFFDGGSLPDQVIDLGGRIISPGLIDVQLNGAFGFNFSTWIDDDKTYVQKVDHVNQKLVETGVTSYMPTITSQTPEMYKKVRGSCCTGDLDRRLT
jgi:N-acetylglucosamine-6-phosphate deacetylase